MTEIYYCKNEDDLKRVAIHIFQNGDNSIEESVNEAGIYCCDFIPDDIECCEECELDECLLLEHIDDKNIHKHIELLGNDIEYPCIVCIADTYYPDEKITICPVSVAKENTKYGCGY